MVVEQVKNCQIENGTDKIINWSKKWEFIDKILKKENLDFTWVEKRKQPYILKIKMLDYYVQFNIYVSNITYMGNPHPKFKKRMQLSESANKSYLRNANDLRNINLMLGLYVYDDNNPIIVAWDSSANKYAGKSKSSHVYVKDIQNAMINGVSQRTDKYKNNIYCFKCEHLKNFFNYNFMVLDHNETFLSYLKGFGIYVDEFSFMDEMVKYLKNDLEEKNFIWDGKKSIDEMKCNSYSKWKETEWQGFFFEYLMQRSIMDEHEDMQQVLEIPGPKYGNTTFDSFYNIPWDFKVHSDNSNRVITNDLDAIEKAIKEYGKVGFIIISGEACYEKDHEFSDWRNELKGCLSKNQLDNISKNKKHRRLKTKFKPERITVLTIDENTIRKHSIVGGFHNPNGNVRRDKLSLDLDKLSEEIIINELFED